MENLLLISEIAQELEQHGNAARIKKLIFAAWRNCWENDISMINKFPLTNILQELINFYPTLEQLRVVLMNIANTLNKKDEYEMVAEIILSRLGGLYLNQAEEPVTQRVHKAMPILSQASIQSSVRDTIVPELAVITNLGTTAGTVQENVDREKDYDAFAARLAVMKYSNPLRAKILLSCVVEEQTSFNQESWLKLRSRHLDELLLEAFQKFSNYEQLESQLYATARNLQEPNENAQAAEAIAKSMKPFYKNIISDGNTSNSAPDSAQDQLFSKNKEEITHQFPVQNTN